MRGFSKSSRATFSSTKTTTGVTIGEIKATKTEEIGKMARTKTEEIGKTGATADVISATTKTEREIIKHIPFSSLLFLKIKLNTRIEKVDFESIYFCGVATQIWLGLWKLKFHSELLKKLELWCIKLLTNYTGSVFPSVCLQLYILTYSL